MTDGGRARRVGRVLPLLVAAALVLVGCGVPEPETDAAAIAGLRRSTEVGPPVGATVGWYEAGSGQPVILVHGTPGSGDGWSDYLADPPEGFRVLAIDRPGFGASGPDGAVTSLAAQAEAVAALLPDDVPVILLGHSLGGPIVAWLAATRPDKVKAVIFLAASLDPGLEDIHPMQRVGAWSPMRALLPRAIRNANAELMALEPELVALRDLLPRIKAPVLIVHGTEDDLVPFANVAYMQQHLTGACDVSTVVLEGANHFLPWNAAPQVRAAIARAGMMTC